ncbi:MAG: hypothetical protein J6A15_02435 [Clostridia bacterium]|nr:hypothetical protein [Clostridia bacterium]
MNITLNINDTYCTKCYKNSRESTTTFASAEQSLELQNNYNLNVLSASNSTFNVIIQNGNCVIIRKIQSGVETSISIPSKNTHIVTITSV